MTEVDLQKLQKLRVIEFETAVKKTSKKQIMVPALQLQSSFKMLGKELMLNVNKIVLSLLIKETCSLQFELLEFDKMATK